MGSLKEFGEIYGKSQAGESESPKPSESPVLGQESNNATISDKEWTEIQESISHTTPISPKVHHDLRSMSWIKINKIVREKDVALVDSLSMIYTALYHTARTIALVVKKTIDGKINLYIGVRDKSEFKDYISKYILQKSISGTIPGIAYVEQQFLISPEEENYVAATIGSASLKGEKKEKFIQGVERIINAAYAIPTFTALFIAENKSLCECEAEKSGLESQYSKLSAIAETTITKSNNTGTTVTETLTNGENKSSAEQKSNTSNESTTTNNSTAKSKGDSNNTNLVLAGEGTSFNETKTDGKSNTKGTSQTTGITTTQGTNTSTAKASGETITKGISEQVKHEHKGIKNTLKDIDSQINKFNGAKNWGLWDFASYFISESKTSALGLSCLYRGIIVGKENDTEKFGTILWADKNQLDLVWQYLREFAHPHFILTNKTQKFVAVVNSRDLAISMSLPQTSVPGILVKELASFGRTITYSGTIPNDFIEVGQVVHLGQESIKDKVSLDENLLTSHTFVTGSTGCGKSNTLYVILQELLRKNKKILVIEPAKGEYKDVIGSLNGVKVYGTNPNVSEILHINPFSFPKGIHVEEHIDRLIDIFNACWPMYAAMPAVLKQSITNAYISCGWDMLKSTNDYDDIFPTFADVVRELRLYINSSEYSQDSKGDYKGALETRLTSLTNGIIGHVFSGETSMDNLFNDNTIVDLSRVGSLETKSLIMGMLILKLNEFRMSENIGMNLPLRHVTVLEEAHNLLRNSTSNTAEGVSVMGKSVEMIAAAIAEMRTYGEGFIIADQSPSLLDRAVISNTNTKIIMNLPNKADREIACASIGLDEFQEKEVARLQTGAAVIFQQGWEEPVLCHIKKYVEKQERLDPKTNEQTMINENKINKELIDSLYDGFALGETLYKSEVLRLAEGTFTEGQSKKQLIDFLRGADEITNEDCAQLFVMLIGVMLFDKAAKEKTLSEMNNVLKSGILKIIGNDDPRIDTFVSMYVKGCSCMNVSPFYDVWLAETNKLN